MKTDQLTFTRFIAALSVVFYHSNLDIAPVNSGLLHDFFANSAVFVSYFFILSGFVMVVAYHDKKVDLRNFYVNRIARIYPLYILALLIIALPKVRHLNIGSMLLQVTLLQSWVPSHAQDYNTPGWSLSTEIFFYIVFPFLLKYFYQKVNLKKAAIVVIIYLIANKICIDSIANYFYPSDSRDKVLFINAFPLFRVYQFIIGNLVGLLFVKKGLKGRRNLDWAVFILFTVIFVGLAYHLFEKVLLSSEIVFAVAIIVLALNTGYISKLFSRKPFVKLGEISYGVYILQASVNTIWYFLKHFGVVTNSINNFYSYLASLIIISYITYKYLEVPAKTFLRNILMPS